MRLINWVVLGFALYAFAFVPLGKRTGLEHVRAILRTPASQEAISELESAGRRLLDELLNETPRDVRGEPVLPELEEANSTPDGQERTRKDTHTVGHRASPSEGDDTQIRPVVPELAVPNLLARPLTASEPPPLLALPEAGPVCLEVESSR